MLIFELIKGFKVSQLTGKISGLKYEKFLGIELPVFPIYSNINDCSSACCIKEDKIIYALSKWASPKSKHSQKDILSSIGDIKASFSKNRTNIINKLTKEASTNNFDLIIENIMRN